MSGEPVFTLDVRARPVGTAYGGKHGVSVRCPVCGVPALRLKTGKAKGIPWEDYTHRLVYSLNHKHEPVLATNDVCRHTLPKPPPKAEDGSSKIAKRSVKEGEK